MKKDETFESALLSLETITKELESGNTSLDKSIDKYKEAMEYVKFCNEKLDSATKTVNKLMKELGSTEDFVIEE